MEIVTYSRTTQTPDELWVSDEVYGALTQSVRELCDAQLRSEVDVDEARAVTAEVRALTRRLSARTRPGSFGIELDHEGGGREHGNAVLGLRNPFAAAVGDAAMFWSERGARATLELGPLYEGPPGCVHGGVIALLLDQVVTEAAAAAGLPGMTATLSVSYRRPTPLGTVVVEAEVESVDGAKRRLRAACMDASGAVAAEGEALLVLPRWVTPDTVWPKRPPRGSAVGEVPSGELDPDVRGRDEAPRV